MKNHRVISQINTIEDLFKVLHLEKSVYFSPINRVMPCKFFLGDSWRYGALQRHLGNFFRCEKKSEYEKRQFLRVRKNLRVAGEIRYDQHPALRGEKATAEIHFNNGGKVALPEGHPFEWPNNEFAKGMTPIPGTIFIK